MNELNDHGNDPRIGHRSHVTTGFLVTGMCNALKSSEKASGIPLLVYSNLRGHGVPERDSFTTALAAGKADLTSPTRSVAARIVFSFAFDSNSCFYLRQVQGNLRQRRR